MKLPKPSDSQGDFDIPEPGVYRMEFTHYDDPVLSSYKKKNGDDQWRVKLEFIIRDEESDYDGFKIMAWYGWSMHPTMSNLYPIIKALLGREPEEDEEPDLDDLIGKHVLGTIDHKKKAGQDGTERVYANLTAAAPIRKKKTAATEPDKPARPKRSAAPSQAQDQSEDDDPELWGDEDESEADAA